MVASNKAYDEITDFLAQLNPQQIIAFRPSQEAQARVEDLIFREKNTSLIAEEKSELDHYIMIEHLMRMAKAKARKLVTL